MVSTLLAVKTQIPKLSPRVLARDRLVDHLEHEIPRHRLTLLSAPAGYGKSTLLAQWARSSGHSVAWLSLDQEDSEFEPFFRYLLAAWEQVDASVMDSPLAVLLSGTGPQSENVLPAFLNLASAMPAETIFVLDDFHLIGESSILEALAFLIDHLPPQLHFVLAGRSIPPLTLARYRAHGQLLELGPSRLAFLRQETADFLNVVMDLHLPGTEVQRIHKQLEGWIAGLQLVALAMGRNPRERGRIEDIDSGHRFIADYFYEDVLAALPYDLQRFLLRASILERLCGPLCAVVTGCQNGQEMLERVEQQNLFLLPLDDHREWFRFHPLFVDFLRQELQRREAEDTAKYHRRAARWYLAQELPEQAFGHAVNGDDVQSVLHILERYAQSKFVGGEFRVVKRWLNALPAAWTAAYPLIDLIRACLLFFTGQLDASARLLAEIEKQLPSAETGSRRVQLAQIRAVRCSLACFQDNLALAETFANQASRDLAEGDHFFRAIIYGSLGDTYRRHGQWRQAKACYLELLEHVRDQASTLHAAHVFGALADLDLRQGNLRDAASYWRKALLAIQQRENWGRLPLPLTGWIYIRAAELLYEWNELTEATGYLSKGLERAELGGDVRAMLAGYLLAGRLKLAADDIEGAEGYLERARPLVESVEITLWRDRFERFQLRWWLAQNDVRAAAMWTERMLADMELEHRQENESAKLTIARALISIEDAPALDKALALLEALLRAAEAEGRASVIVEGLALQALAQWKQGKEAAALTALEHALYLAEPQGYVRLFVDLGLSMGRLLQRARSRALMLDYVGRLLAAFSGAALQGAPTPEALPEPLTDRELQVLGLLAAGLTNRQIAIQLSISPLTVKTHAANIYGKLGVNSRTEAATRARELELLH